MSNCNAPELLVDSCTQTCSKNVVVRPKSLNKNKNMRLLIAGMALGGAMWYACNLWDQIFHL